jgi:4-hydroxy-2-oxoheptanedioate aldolase
VKQETIMRTNTVKQLLREGKPAIGTWLVLPDPYAASFMARVGFDWLTVEMEHSPITLDTAALMFQMIAQAGGVPLVRIPWRTGENIKRVLDCGAWGIVFPMTNSADEAEAAVAAAKYPPRGSRSVGGSLAAMTFGTDNPTYYARANDETMIIIQMEHIQAVEHADEILRVPGIDAIFIGPTDLSASMGKTPSGEVEDPEVQEAIRHVRTVAATHGVASGIHVFSPEAVAQRVQEGFRFVALASDARFMTGGAKAALKRSR